MSGSSRRSASVLELPRVGDGRGVQLLELVDDEQQRAAARRRPPSLGGQAQLGHGLGADAHDLDVPALAAVEPVLPQPGGDPGEGQRRLPRRRPDDRHERWRRSPLITASISPSWPKNRSSCSRENGRIPG